MRVFVAGASGAIGEPLIAELLKQGHSVVGMTTSEAGAKNLQRQGAEAVIADAFDARAVEASLRRSKAEAVIDELTSLPKEQSDMPNMPRATRSSGSRAAVICFVRRSRAVSGGIYSSPADFS